MVEMQNVQSSNVESVGYDANAMELHVRFLSGPTVYAYHGVPEVLFEQLLSAPSKGGFVNTQIKNVYTFDRR